MGPVHIYHSIGRPSVEKRRTTSVLVFNFKQQNNHGLGTEELDARLNATDSDLRIRGKGILGHTEAQDEEHGEKTRGCETYPLLA
jgi:hypothetical protein